VNLSTEVITRTKIDVKTGTVAKSALFSEEYLPAESIMYSLAIASSIFMTKDKKEQFINGKNDKEAVISYWEENMPKIMQIGGNANIGKGIVEIVIPKMEDTNANN
jgi:CRISPR-associated protein Cmr4